MTNEKIDKRISYKLVIDTETCPLVPSAKVEPSNMFVYDIGWAVVDKRGKVYATRSFVNMDIFLGESELMKSAYYANKIPNYYADLENGTRKLASFYMIRQYLFEDMKKYNITQVYAHNMRFDYGVLVNTMRWLTKSKYRYFFPYGVEICDTLKMARDVVGKMPTYRRFCEENGYLTSRNQLRYTAEVLYRFITRDTEFTESHTGLEDVMIEKEILAYCYRQHKKMRRKLWD